MATVTISGQTFEAGASILHPKNYHTVNFTKLLNLKPKDPPSSEDSTAFGIWDGSKFVFKTISVSSTVPFVQKIVSLANSVLMVLRYGLSLLRMESFTENAVDKFLKYYESFETRPVFESVDEMLKWAGLFNLTARSLEEELIDARLSPLLMQELVTVSLPGNFCFFFLMFLQKNYYYFCKILELNTIL